MSLAPATRARLQATLAAIGTLVIWLWRGGLVPATFAVLMAALALLAWTSPARYAPVQRALDHGLHLVLTALTWLLLGLVYLVVFTPFRLLRDLSGSDPLRKKSEPATTSYLEFPPPAGRFDRQF